MRKLSLDPGIPRAVPVYSPDAGNTFAPYEPDGTLSARIFKGIPLFGKTEVLTRVDLHSLTGLC